MKSKRNIAIVLIAVVALVGIIFLMIRNDFDAKGYVEAILSQTLKGEVEDAAEIVEGATEESLYQQYEEGIMAFVDHNLLNNVEVEEETRQKFVVLWEDVFKSLRYEVKEAEKMDDDEYVVKVEVEPTDVFLKFVESVEAEQQYLKDKVEAGEYKGTEEEITAQMQQDVLLKRYETLQTAYDNQQYSEKVTVELRVTSNDEDVFSINEEDISNMITKILRLDEIQD